MTALSRGHYDLSATLVGEWYRHFSAECVESFEEIAGAQLKEAGYTLEAG